MKAKVRVVVWIDGVECGAAENEVPSDLAVHVAQAALVQVEEPDLDLAFENQSAELASPPTRSYTFPDEKKAGRFFDEVEQAAIERDWIVSLTKAGADVDVRLEEGVVDRRLLSEGAQLPPIEWFDEKAADFDGVWS